MPLVGDYQRFPKNLISPPPPHPRTINFPPPGLPMTPDQTDWNILKLINYRAGAVKQSL